jgi:hypothetical protein
MTREADFPHQHFFPAMRPLTDSELPARNDIRRIFAAAHFTPAAHEIVQQVVHKSSLRADSFLARLSNRILVSEWPTCARMVGTSAQPIPS